MILKTNKSPPIQLNEDQEFRIKNIAVAILMMNIIAGISLVKWFVFSDDWFNPQLFFFIGFYIVYSGMCGILEEEIYSIIDKVK